MIDVLDTPVDGGWLEPFLQGRFLAPPKQKRPVGMLRHLNNTNNMFQTAASNKSKVIRARRNDQYE